MSDKTYSPDIASPCLALHPKEASRIAQSALGDSMVSMHTIAKRVGVSYRCVQAWRKKGLLPPPDFAMGHVLRWRPSTINKFLSSRSSEVAR